VTQTNGNPDGFQHNLSPMLSSDEAPASSANSSFPQNNEHDNPSPNANHSAPSESCDEDSSAPNLPDDEMPHSSINISYPPDPDDEEDG